MKNLTKQLFAVMMLAVICITAGCTTTLKDATGNPVINPATGQVVKVADTNSIAGVGSMLGTVNAITAPVNPYAVLTTPLVSWGTAGFLALSTILAAYQNQNKKSILQAVIQGIEGSTPAGGNDLTSINLAQVKQSIQSAASAAGVQPDLHSLVVANT